MDIVKLIYSKNENDIGFIDGNYEIDHKHEILDMIGENIIDKERLMQIYTWGIKKYSYDQCDVVFDATLFNTKIDVDVKSLTGLDEVIQTSVINHPMFDIIIEKILTYIEEKKPKSIGFICNYGKHRSVAFAEILKKLYYPKSNINHLCLLRN